MKKERVAILIILILGAFLRIWRLGAESLWKDEIFSMLEAQRPIVEIFTTKTYFFGYAPLHHFFTHLALYLGKSEFIVRFPSVIFGLATVFLIYKIGEILFSKNVGLISAFLLSISPFHLEYSREVRYYSYLFFFSGLTIYFLFKLVLEKRRRWLILFVLATVLNIATQATALLVLFAQLIFLGVWFLPKRQKKIQRNFLSTLFLALPLITIGTLFIKSFNELFTSIKLKPAMPPFEFLVYIFTNLSGEKIVAIFYFILFIWGVLYSLKKKRKEALSLCLLLIFPLIILYFVRPEAFGFHIRYVSFIIFPYLLFISYGVSNLLKNRLILTFGLIGLTCINIPGIQAYYQTKRGDWRGVGKYLIENAKSGDVVITETFYNKILLDYYLEAQKRGLILKTAAESLHPKEYPFDIYYLQHDYVKEGKPNQEEVYFKETDKIISFDPQAAISPMYIFTNKRKTWFWQEGEFGWIRNEGWEVSDNFGKLTIGTDNLSSPEAKISYKVNLSEKGTYDLFINLRWDGVRGNLSYKIDQGLWSTTFEPFYGEKGQINPMIWREEKIGSIYLTKGEHEITFMNTKQKEHNIYQTIDYFYLSLND